MDKMSARLGLIVIAPLIFIVGGLHGIYRMFEEFWNYEEEPRP